MKLSSILKLLTGTCTSSYSNYLNLRGLRTLDHVAADGIGKATPFSTLELSCNDHKNNIESIYFDNMSWYATGHVAPSMRNPRKVYDRLFGTQSSSRFRNITDLALGNAKQLQKRLSKNDQRKFDEYFEAIRTIETRMDRIDSMESELAEVEWVNDYIVEPIV